jgi:LCP family protein required for cell wall assembly
MNRASTPQPPRFGAPPPRAPDRAERFRPRFLLRALAGCLVALACAAGVGAAVAAHQVSTLSAAIDERPSLDLSSGQLAPAGWGDAQTLLLIGNDQRKHTTTAPVLPHDNENLLIRFDPSKPWISMMSIPRELLTTIDTKNGPVQTRFNYAMTAGGIPLVVKTVRQVLGIEVNHVAAIDFNNFRAAVDKLGCIYGTIDRRYYHVNAPGGPQYQEIDLQPGYQKLCGAQALEFVSYRHGDTSLVRDARDQRFLLWARQQLEPGLLSNISKYERIFGQTVQTDPSLHTTNGLDNLIGTLISTGSEPVRQVKFQVDLNPASPLARSCGCVTASQQQISASVDSFLNGAEHLPKTQTAAVARQVQRAVHHGGPSPQRSLVATPAFELVQARSAASHLRFPLEFPRVADDSLAGPGPVNLNGCPATANWLTCMRTYVVHSPRGLPYPAYVIVQQTGLLGQYYDIEGSTWTSAPAFRDPNQSLTVGGRTYELYYEGSHISMVAWFEHRAAYWITNSLTDGVSNGDLLAIAEQTDPVGMPAAPAPAPRPLRLVAVKAPRPVVAKSGSGGSQLLLGGLSGLVALVALPLLGFLTLRSRHHAIRGREGLAQALGAGR